MRIKEANKWKIVFKTQYGYFEYYVMLFGLSNTTISFQKYIKKILAKMLNIFIIIYPNNILISVKDLRQGHVNAVCWILDILRKNRLFTNLKKCCFHKDKVCLLGYIVLV